VAGATPIVSWAALALTGLGPARWLSVNALFERGASADALLYTAAAVIAGAPLLGVAACREDDAGPPRGVVRTIGTVVLAVGALGMASALVTVLGRGVSAETLALVWQSHAMLAAVALALALLGAACGAAFRDPLVGAAVSLAVTVVAAAGVLVAGAGVADLPRSALALALTASPLVAVASAAHIDIVRMEPLYQISPLAHLSIEYPAWRIALAWHLAVAVACGVALTWTHRTWRTPLAT
jgi:hypothetical protein